MIEFFTSHLEYLGFLVFFVGLFSIGLFCYFKFKGRRIKTKKEVIIIGTTNSSIKFAHDLVRFGKRVKIISENGNNPQLSKLQKLGVKIHFVNGIESSIIEESMLKKCSLLVLSCEEDVQNINILDYIFKIHRSGLQEDHLTVLVKINQEDTRSLLLDYANIYSLERSIYLHIFNPFCEFAKTIYDRFPPYLFVNDETVNNKKKVVVMCGYSPTAEFFLLENCVLSHFDEGQKLKIIHIAKNAEQIKSDILFRRPHLNEYIQYVPVEMRNKSFVDLESWSSDIYEDILSMDVAYCFGDDDGVVLNMALRFKQQMYNALQNVRAVPVIACLPETSDIFNILGEGNAQQKSVLGILDETLRVHTVQMHTDGAQIAKYISSDDEVENIAKVVNYYYAVSYEFPHLLNKHFKKNNANHVIQEIKTKILHFSVKNHSPLFQIEDMVLAELLSYTKGSSYNLKSIFGIEEHWRSITERSRESNRYVARDVASKAAELKKAGVHKFDAEIITDYAHLLSASIHKRWAAEKQNANFIYGKLDQRDPKFKKILKSQLKVHDLLLPYEELPEFEKGKDVEMLKLLPLLVDLKKIYDRN